MSELTVYEPSAITTNGERARRYAVRSKAAKTLKTYAAAWREFEGYAGKCGQPALPASEETVVSYLVDLAESGQKAGTIAVKLAAIAWRHRLAKATDPTVFETVKTIMAGIRRKLGTAPAKKEPATLEEIRAMLATLDTDTLKGKRDKALLLVGFAGAFRRSELVALDVADLRFNDKLTIMVRQSKTDQEGKGLVKTIPEIGDTALCPVVALRDWLDTAGIASGAVFRHIDRHGNLLDRLTSQSVALVVKGAARAAGLDWRAFAGHSLRSGFITEALNAGGSDSDIIEQTGQSKETMLKYRKSTGVGASRVVKLVFGEGSNGR